MGSERIVGKSLGVNMVITYCTEITKKLIKFYSGKKLIKHKLFIEGIQIMLFSSEAVNADGL